MINLLAVSRVAFKIKDFEVYWYGIIICAAILIAILVASIYSKKKGYSLELPINIAIVILPTGILGARLFAVLFDSSLSISDYFNFRTGGMSIIGAIIVGGLALLIYMIIKKVDDKFKYFDTLCVVLILAQAIGRWGNYFNSEVYGQVIEASSFFARFPFAVEVNGVFYQALFFYESCADLFGFYVLSLFYLQIKKTGLVSGIYLIYYGVVRMVLETMRQSQYILRFCGLPISLICSAIMVVLGIGILVYVSIKNKKKEAKNG